MKIQELLDNIYQIRFLYQTLQRKRRKIVFENSIDTIEWILELVDDDKSTLEFRLDKLLSEINFLKSEFPKEKDICSLCNKMLKTIGEMK